MYQTSWLSIIGLLIEMVGLTLLFVDLLRAKRLTDSTTAIRTLQDRRPSDGCRGRCVPSSDWSVVAVYRRAQIAKVMSSNRS